ncbi:centrosome-associated protein 350-like isoform X3 [Mytilus californianus]|uniref:centrosome-associated protein 350-like isoform X3 n=1 Tax=Mytilus californianus TaxID=6549 RepID=UPI00224745D5|nr:centrosome-associated protein 350-like isoform X3 [Mytilus californianus]
MLSLIKMAEAVSGLSETHEENEITTSTENKSSEDQLVSNQEDTDSQTCQQDLTQQLKDTEHVSTDNGSSVDPEPEVLIALAQNGIGKIKNTEENLDEKDGDEIASQEADTFTDISPAESENFEEKNDDIDSDFKESEKFEIETSEKFESETSEIIFSENLLNDSEISEKISVQEELLRDSLNSTQEEVGIFITQDHREEENQPEEMPEKREEEVVSPSLQRANLRFRWAKTIPVSSNEIIFFSSHKMEEPLKLTWSEGADCFYSKDLEVPTGMYKGTLVIDEKSYPIDEVTVKHYTFEADLYVKDDVIEDNFSAGRETTVEDVNTFSDLNKSSNDQTGLHYTGKIEDIIRQQMHSVSPEQEFTVKSDHGSGRHTPIGDVGFETYQDGLNNSYSKHLNASVVEDEIEQSFNQSQHSSKPHTPQPTVEEIIENTLRESRSQERTTPQSDRLADFFSSEDQRTSTDKILNGDGSLEFAEHYKSPSSSARQTPQRDYIGDVLGYDQPKSTEGSVHSFEQSRTPVRSIEGSLHGSARHTPLEGSLHGSDRRTPLEGSMHGSTRHTPLEGSLHGSDRRTPLDGSLHGSDRRTPLEGSVHESLGRHTPLDDLVQTVSPAGSFHGSTHSSARQTPLQTAVRQTPSESFRTSQENLYGSHSSLSGHGGSRPLSLTSEQELTQYFEQSSKRFSEPVSTGSTKTPTPQQYASGIQNNGNRAHGTSSLPVITTQQRLQAEKRSKTPDNYIRVPGNMTSPAAVARPSSTTRGSTPSSRASNRTITPGDDAERQLSMDSVMQKRVEDLEDTVRNLRKLLSAREQEVHELTDQLNDIRDINRSLQDDLEHSREKQSSTPKPGSNQELEKRYGLLSNEKEILAQEVVNLHDHINDLQRRLERDGRPDGETHPSISSYDPNNPNALQRKIADLQSQVQDLQEANESAVLEVNNSDRKIKELTKQNESLRTTQNVGHQDLHAENRMLHDKISKLWEQGYGDSDHKVRVENQQLRDDNRAIRERNYKLHEENLKLKEEITEIRRVLERQSSDSKISRISVGSLDREHMDSKYSSIDRSKLPSLGIEKSPTTSLTLLNGHVDHRPVQEKDGHRYSYRQNKEEKLYSGLSERESVNKYSTHTDESKYRTSMEKSEPYLRNSYVNDDLKSSYDTDARTFRDVENKDESRFRSSLERAEAKLRNSLEKNSYLDKITRYETKGTDRLKTDKSLDRSRTPERPKSETYRSMPDGISDKDERSPSQRYDLTPNRHHDNRIERKTEYEKRSDYGLESKSLTSIDRDYKTLTASYPELARIVPTSDAEKRREMSRSEVDLRPKRGRSRSPNRHNCTARSASPKRGLPKPSGFRFRNITKHRMPHQMYKWDGRFACAQCGSHLLKHLLGLNRTEGYLRDEDMSRYTCTRPRVDTRVSYSTQDYYNRDYDAYNSYDKKYTSYQSDGNESDTATDILVSAQPYEQRISPVSPVESPDHKAHSKYHRRSYSQRRDSLGSDCSSIEDVEESYSKQRLHNRSKSADGRELLRRTEPMGSSGRSPTPNRTDRYGLTTGDPGFRSITPNVLPTQHNRSLDRGSLTNITSGLRPFAPRTPGDINIEDVVKFSRQGGKLSQGKIKFVGHLPGRSDIYLGVELDKEDGKHDGTFEGVRYYKCKPNKGVFVAFNKVVMAWAPNL